MKKLFIIVVTCTLQVQLAQGMFDLSGNVKAAVHYAEKWINPEGYILNSQNAKLYESVLNDINEKNISTLRTTQFPDENGVLHTFDDTFKKRVAERSSTLIPCLFDLSLVQDPNKQDGQKLYDMIRVNSEIISNASLGLAYRALSEQKNIKIVQVDDAPLVVAIELQRIAFLDEENQLRLKTELDKLITSDQKRKLAKQYLLSLPAEEQEKFLQEMSGKRIALSKEKSHDNSSSAKTPEGNDPEGKKKSASIAIILQKEKSLESSSPFSRSFDKEKQQKKKRMALDQNSSPDQNSIDNGRYDGGNVMVDAMLDLGNEILDGDAYVG